MPDPSTPDRWARGWSKLVGVLGLVIFLLGALFFLYTKTESLTIGFAARGEGTSLTVAGETADWMSARIHAAVAGAALPQPL